MASFMFRPQSLCACLRCQRGRCSKSSGSSLRLCAVEGGLPAPPRPGPLHGGGCCRSRGSRRGSELVYLCQATTPLTDSESKQTVRCMLIGPKSHGVELRRRFEGAKRGQTKTEEKSEGRQRSIVGIMHCSIRLRRY